MEEERDFQIAMYLIATAHRANQRMNITKLMKLIYIAYGIYLVTTNSEEARLLEERPRAWPYGPVFPQIRAHFNNQNFKEITFERIAGLTTLLDNDQIAQRAINTAIQYFGKYSAKQLTDWSHKEGSPWWIATNGDKYWDTPILDCYTRVFFESIVKS